MTRKEHGVLTALAVLGLLLAGFQCWYVYLPEREAAAFDLCQLTRRIDCFQSLHKFGGGMTPFGVPVFASLLALFLWQASLCAAAWTADGGRREARLATARVLFLPLAGLAAYVLMHDYLVAGATSVSSILVAALSLGGAGHLVLRGGVKGVPLHDGLGSALALALFAGAFGWFVHGAGAARLEIERVEMERETRPPQIRWASFARDVPRRHAAMLGNPVAEREVLLFVDPAQEASRARMREAAELDPGPDSDVLIVLYAPGDHGAALVLAAAEGRLLRHLRAPSLEGDLAQARGVVERQEQAARRLGVESYPTAVWKSGRRSGDFRLADVLRTAD